MDNINKYNSDIDAYVNGELKGLALEKFEALLETNKDIRMEVQLKKQLQEGFEIVEAKELKKRFKTIKKDALQSQSNVRSISWMKYAVAASFLALVLFGLNKTLFVDSAPVDNYANYFEAYPMDIYDRSDANVLGSQAKTAYENKNYTAAIPTLTQLIESDAAIQWKLYRGISYLESGNIQAAITDLQQVQNANDMTWSDHGSWYLALAYLKADNPALTKSTLQSLISSPDADHLKEAKELLGKLGSD